MEVSVAQQTTVLLWSAVLGAALGAVYDVFRIARVVIRPGRIALALQDLLFCLICAAAVVVEAFIVNSGEVRWYMLIGSVCGFVIYYNTIGSVVYAAAQIVIDFVKRALRFLGRMVTLPFRLLYRLVRPIALRAAAAVKKFGRNAKNLFSYRRKRGKILLSIRSGRIERDMRRKKEREAHESKEVRF